MKKAFLFLAAFFLIQPLLFAQKENQAKIDSLLAELKKIKEDTVRLRLFAELMNAHIYFKPEEGLNYQGEALELAEKARSPLGKARIIDRIGRLNWRLGNFGVALKNHLEALDMFTKAGDRYKNYVLVEIGQDWLDSGRTATAETYLLKALKLNQEAGDRKTMSNAYDILIYLYNGQGNTSEMIKMSYSYLKLCEEMGDKRGLVNVDYITANYYQSLGNKKEALKYFIQAMQASKDVGDRMGEASFHSILGGVYLDMGNIAEARDNYLTALRLAREVGDLELLAHTSMGYGNLLTVQKKYNEPVFNYTIAKQGFAHIKEKESQAIASYKIVYVYTRAGQYERAARAFAES